MGNKYIEQPPDNIVWGSILQNAVPQDSVESLVGYSLQVTPLSSGITYELIDEAKDINCSTTNTAGFASLSFSLIRPITSNPPELEWDAFVKLSRRGFTMFEGRLEDMSRTYDKTNGSLFTIGANGFMSALNDDEAYIKTFADADMGNWDDLQNQKVAKYFTVETEDENDKPILRLAALDEPQPTSQWKQDWGARFVYYHLGGDGLQKIGGLWINYSSKELVRNNIEYWSVRIYKKEAPNGGTATKIWELPHSGVKASDKIFIPVPGGAKCLVIKLVCTKTHTANEKTEGEIVLRDVVVYGDGVTRNSNGKIPVIDIVRDIVLGAFPDSSAKFEDLSSGLGAMKSYSIDEECTRADALADVLDGKPISYGFYDNKTFKLLDATDTPKVMLGNWIVNMTGENVTNLSLEPSMSEAYDVCIIKYRHRVRKAVWKWKKGKGGKKIKVKTFRNVVRPVTKRYQTSAPFGRIKLLDFEDRILDDDEAKEIADNFLAQHKVAYVSGSVTVSSYISDAQGIRHHPTKVRAGDYVLITGNPINSSYTDIQKPLPWDPVNNPYGSAPPGYGAWRTTTYSKLMPITSTSYTVGSNEMVISFGHSQRKIDSMIMKMMSVT
jgi:hypothetical protein